MWDMLSFLEPRYEPAHTIIFDENEEVNEVSLFTEGEMGLGFELNKTIKIAFSQKDEIVVGAWEISFGRRSQFVYKTLSSCDGFFIRKTKWVQMIRSNEQIADELVD